MKLSTTLELYAASDPDCDWVTISGTHVCIDSGGTVKLGSPELVGQPVHKLRAKLSYVPATKAMQDKGDEWQHKIAKAIGGKETSDNMPMDVMKGKHGVEVKTIQTSKKDRVEMRPDSRARKEAHAKQYGLKAHTVAVDLRSGRPAIYYKQGIGAYRFGSMERVTLSQLKDKFK